MENVYSQTILLPFCPIQAKQEFPRKSRLSLLRVYESLTSCKFSERNYEPIPRKVLISTSPSTPSFPIGLLQIELLCCSQTRGSNAGCCFKRTAQKWADQLVQLFLFFYLFISFCSSLCFSGFQPYLEQSIKKKTQKQQQQQHGTRNIFRIA